MNPLTKRLLALGASSVIAVTGGFLVAPWEGKSNNAYKDLVGIPTICFGETKNVHMGDYKTDKECEESLAHELTNYNQAMKKHVKVPLKEYEEVAYTSFIWNLGETNWKKSAILKKLNDGDNPGACAQLLRWNMAGGKVVKGLDNRRKDEYKTCIGGKGDVNAALAELALNGEGPIDISTGVAIDSTEEAVVEPPEPLPEPVVVDTTCSFKVFGVCIKRK